MTAGLAADIAVHTALGLALAAAVWLVGAGCLVLVRRSRDARSSLDAYPLGLLVAMAAAALPLLWRPLAAVSVPALGALAVLGARGPALPTLFRRGRLALALVGAAGFGAGLGALLHGPTSTTGSAAYGGMLFYVDKVVSATRSIVPFRDLLAEGEEIIYAEAGTSFVGAALSALPGFDPLLYHAATLPAFAAASLVLGLVVWSATRPSAPPVVAAGATLLAVASVAYPTWVTETPPSAFALPMVFTLWRVWRDELDGFWLAALASVAAVDFLLTKVVALMVLGPLVVFGLIARTRNRPDFRRIVIIGGTALAAAAGVVIAVLFTFASWYAGLWEPKAVPLDAVRALADGNVDARSFGLALLVAGEVVLAISITRARSWALLAMFVIAVVPSWFVAGYGFDIAVFSTIFLAALVLFEGEGLDASLALVAGVLLALAAATREVLGTQPGMLLVLTLVAAFGATLAPRVPRLLVYGAAALAAAVLFALADLPALAVASLAVVAFLAVFAPRAALATVVAAGIAAGAAAAPRGLDVGDPVTAVTSDDRDIWAEVRERVPANGLVFTSLTGLEVTPHRGWNNYPAVAGRQLFIAGWYDGRLVSDDEDRDRKLAENRAVLEGRLRPDELDLSRDYDAFVAVTRVGDRVPASFRETYRNDAYVLYEIR